VKQTIFVEDATLCRWTCNAAAVGLLVTERWLFLEAVNIFEGVVAVSSVMNSVIYSE